MRLRTKLSAKAFFVAAMMVAVGGQLAVAEVGVAERDGAVTIENGLVKVIYDLSAGTFSAVDKRDGSVCITDAFFQLDDLASNEAGLRHAWEGVPLEDELGNGMALIVACSKPGQPNLLLKIALDNGQGYIVLSAGIENTTDRVVQLKQIRPLVRGRIFEGSDLSKGFSMLDGHGGGQPTAVTHDYNLHSRNNLLVTFGEPGGKRSLVIGGLTYHEFEKFADARQDWTRCDELERRGGRGQSFLCYLDLPEKKTVGKGGVPALRLIQGNPYKFGHNIAQHFATIAYDNNEVVLEATGLVPERAYQLGFSWWDEKSSRVESVLVDAGPGTPQHVLLEKQPLPAGSKKQEPKEILLALPPQAYRTGRMRIIFRKESGPNAVLSEVWLYERVGSAEAIIETAGDFDKKPPISLNIQLSAVDAVGKRVDPGVRYLPDDRFYVDFTTDNPFEALEKYGLSIRAAQKIKLNVYDFPTVCLWYADCYNKQSVKNNSAGAVEEMDHIVKSGFLKYSKVAVRLVPDDYEECNQNGWWDDEHWQRVHAYNTSMPSVDPAVKPYKYVYKPGKQEPGSYKKPYETTEKWGKAVTQRGGIPLIYFQPGHRSQDYAEAFPGHMLFNQVNAPVLDGSGKPRRYGAVWNWSAWRSGKIRKYGYDYTDPGFIRHMREVYANLRSGGVKGLMFDYPSQGWVNGGMEDKYATAARAYRNIFRLAHEGLGPDCYIHERNLGRGSDVTVGVVTSQRIWTDCELLKPEMVARGGLRWYKDRVIFNYDMDGKTLHRADPNCGDGPWDGKPPKTECDPKSRYRIQALLTVSYVAGSRLLLANSFGRPAKEHLHALSRLYPSHPAPRRARPVDAFIGGKYPCVYDFKIDSHWHQLAFYNWEEEARTIGVDLAGDTAFGALGLNAKKDYYVYDFWNDRLVGKFSGGGRLEQDLRPGEARMMSVREVLDRPQFISTNRHIMQGYLDMVGIPKWDAAQLSLTGTSKVVGGETYKVILATNGYRPVSSTAVSAESKVELLPGNDRLARLSIDMPENATVKWTVTFGKPTLPRS